MPPNAGLGHLRGTTINMSLLDEWPARRMDLYLATHNTNNSGIRTHNLSRWATADLRLIPRGHWDRQNCVYVLQKFLDNLDS